MLSGRMIKIAPNNFPDHFNRIRNLLRQAFAPAAALASRDYSTPFQAQTKSLGVAFLFASGQGLLVTAWVFIYFDSWPTSFKLLVPVLWFTVLLAAILRLTEPESPAVKSEPGAAPVPTENKSDMRLATISHEMKTPLNAILGFSEILDKEYGANGSPKGREYARLIHESGRHLLSVVNSMLDLAKIDSGTYQLDCEPLSAVTSMSPPMGANLTAFDSRLMSICWQARASPCNSPGLPTSRRVTRID